MQANKQKLAEILQKIGLSEKETLVYLAALQKGESTALELANSSGVKRGTVYTVIDTLKTKGVMSETLRGLKKKFVAESPSILEQILDDHREQLHEHLPQLLQMHRVPTTEQRVKVSEGAEGIRAGLDSMLADIEVGDYYLVIANFESLHEILPKFVPKFLERRSKYNIKIRTILQEGPQARQYQSRQKFYNDTVKIFPENFKFAANVVLTPKRVLFPQLFPYTGAVIIENPQVVKTMEQLFEVIWSSVPGDKSLPESNDTRQ